MADATENTIRKLLENLEKVSTDLKKGKVNEIIKTAIETVKSAVKDLASVVQSEKGKTDHLQNQVRNQGDEIDHQKQRNMKGKIIISSVAKEGKPCLIKSADDLNAEGKSLEQHVADLIEEKYDTKAIKAEEIDTCYHLPKGGIFISFFNTLPGSAFQRLATEIKSAKGQQKNVYFNFMLTKKRSHLLFEVRKLKQNKTIFKYFSDEDGKLSIKVNKNGKSEKLTNIRIKDTSMLKIMSIEEMQLKVQELKQ